MSRKLLLLVGTVKGVFIFESNESRTGWSLRGPYCEAWPINHVIGDPASGTIYAGGGGTWFGPAVWKSSDLGESWTHSSEGLSYGEGEDPVKSVWSIAPASGSLFAGVEPAGLFRSDDDGESWIHVSALRDHPSRPDWMPGGGGLILHGMLRHPEDADQLWVAISAAGLFHTADGGRSWTPRNKGIRNDYMPEGHQYPEVGHCVHSVVMAPGQPDRLYQQNHCGMYRSDDAGLNWENIGAGLPSTFGFPSAVHPRDPDTLFLLPLNGDVLGRYVPDGKAAVWRTRDGGKSWQDLRAGLPQQNAFFAVLRQAMTIDRQDPAGIYFGTNSGTLFASNDEGDSWQAIAEHLPTILSLETMTVDE